VLNQQGRNSREMVNSKLSHIKKIETNLDRLKSKIKEKILEDKQLLTLQVQKDMETQQVQDTYKSQFISAFSVYVSEKKQQMASLHPELTLL
jgi:N-glycosylase/DNA lyase